MKTSTAASIAASALLVGCGNATIKGVCDHKEEGTAKVLSLDGALSDEGAPGGFLVYDEIATDSFSKTGNLAGSIVPNRKCSAVLAPRKRSGKAYFEVISAENCLRPFVWGALNQRIFLYRPESKSYQAFKVSDARIQATPKLFDLFAKLPLNARTRAVNESFVEKATGPYEYAVDIKKMSEAEETAFYASQCWTIGKATPDPEDCLWLSGSRSDFIEVAPTAAQDFDSLVTRYEAFEKSRLTKINMASYGTAAKISTFTGGKSQFSAIYDDFLARNVASFWIDCKDAAPTDYCNGLTLAQRKALSANIIGLYQPTRVSEYDAAFEAADRAAAKKAMKAKIKADLVDGVSVTLAPALEAYFSLRNEFSRHKELVSVLSNHLDGTKFEPGKVRYRSLSPFASKVPEPLKSITFAFNDGNILLTHPGFTVNQNLAMDGHIGSVIAFGGLPIFAFTPANIDQSDRASEMPLPRTSERADVPARAPGAGETAKGSAKDTPQNGRKGC